MNRINRWKLGMIQGVSNRSMDGLSRSYYVQSRTSWEDEAGDQRVNQTILDHRCPDDIILLLTARDTVSNQLFKEDLQKQHQLLKVTQQTSNLDLGLALAFDSNNGIADANITSISRDMTGVMRH